MEEITGRNAQLFVVPNLFVKTFRVQLSTSRGPSNDVCKYCYLEGLGTSTGGTMGEIVGTVGLLDAQYNPTIINTVCNKTR